MRTTAVILTVTLLLPFGAAMVLADEPPAPEKPAAEDARIQKLIQQLGADDYKTRATASEELAKIGEPARKALEDAAKNGDSPETRWRAEQILRRLQGGEAEPMDGTEEEPDANEPNELSDLQRQMEAIRKLWERAGRRLPVAPGGRNWNPFGPDKLKAPGLLLEKDAGGVKLTVTSKDANGVDRDQVYRGKSLDEIVARNPDLKRHAGMAELKKKLDPFADWKDLLNKSGAGIRIAPGGGATRMYSTQGLTVREDANGATVTVTEKDEDGNPVQKVYKGESLDEIKKKHPHLKDRLDKIKTGITFSFGPTTFLRRGQRGFPFERLRPTTPSTDASARTFGIVVVPVESVLAYHLGLAENQGALVTSVIPGSQAEKLGVKRNDIVLSVNGQAVNGPATLPALVREPVHTNAAMELDIIRRGEKTKLVR